MRKLIVNGSSAVVMFFIGLSCFMLVRSVSKAPMESLTIPSTRPFTRAPAQDIAPFLLNEVCTSSDQLNYEGFEASRSYDANSKKSRVTIKRGGPVLAVHGDGKGLRMNEASCFGLSPVLGGKTKQLVVVQTSGGAHCCFRYRIYDLRPKFRLLFDSAKYPIGDGFDELEFKDIDSDGIQEFTQRDMTFDYWEDLSYASSPQPRVVFQYNQRAKKFYPASKKFSAYLVKDIREDIKKLNRSDPHQHWVSSLDITLRYIFAGQEKAAWKFYDKEFGIKPGERDKMKTKIENALTTDLLYRSIYKR